MRVSEARWHKVDRFHLCALARYMESLVGLRRGGPSDPSIAGNAAAPLPELKAGITNLGLSGMVLALVGAM